MPGLSSAGPGITGPKGQMFWEIILLAKQNPQVQCLFRNVKLFVAEKDFKPVFTAPRLGSIPTKDLPQKEAGAPHRRNRYSCYAKSPRGRALPSVLLPPLKMEPCGQIINGCFREQTRVTIPSVELKPKLELSRWDRKFPCRGKIVPGESQVAQHGQRPGARAAWTLIITSRRGGK